MWALIFAPHHISVCDPTSYLMIIIRYSNIFCPPDKYVIDIKDNMLTSIVYIGSHILYLINHGFVCMFVSEN